MVLTKPEPKEHYDAMTIVAQNVVDQEMASDNVKKKYASRKCKENGFFLCISLDFHYLCTQNNQFN